LFAVGWPEYILCGRGELGNPFTVAASLSEGDGNWRMPYRAMSAKRH